MLWKTRDTRREILHLLTFDKTILLQTYTSKRIDFA
jgi:hypothetical protein